MLVLCSRGRHPSEAAAHRQERGGCPQLDARWSRRELSSPRQPETSLHPHPAHPTARITAWFRLTPLSAVDEAEPWRQTDLEAAPTVCSAAVRSSLHYLVLLTQPRGVRRAVGAFSTHTSVEVKFVSTVWPQIQNPPSNPEAPASPADRRPSGPGRHLWRSRALVGGTISHFYSS